MKNIVNLGILSLLLLNCNDKKEQENQLTYSTEKETSQKKDSPQTTILIEDANYSFGNIKKGEQVQKYFRFSNTGTQPLILSEVSPSCGCTTPSFPKEPIAPGKKDSILVKFNSSNFEGEVHKSVSVSGNFPQTAIQFTANIKK